MSSARDLRSGGDCGGGSCGRCWCGRCWGNGLLFLLLNSRGRLDRDFELGCCNNLLFDNRRGGNCRTNLSHGQRSCLSCHWCSISLRLTTRDDRRLNGLRHLTGLQRSLIWLDHCRDCLNFWWFRLTCARCKSPDGWLGFGCCLHELRHLLLC